MHFMRNALAYVGRSGRLIIADPVIFVAAPWIVAELLASAIDD